MQNFLWVIGIDKAHFNPTLGPRAPARIEADMNCGVAVGDKGELDIWTSLDFLLLNSVPTDKGADTVPYMSGLC